MAVHIGISGWSHDHWRGVLYPMMPSRATDLNFYTKHFL
jgi:uncharacterized protein YecE (DUF72 family)